MKEIKLVITQDIVDEYNKCYLEANKRRRKNAIDRPTHPSINKWFIMKRPQMNALKQKIKDFIIWFVENQGLTNRKIQKCDMTFVSYFKTKIRADTDNTVPKFYLDGFVEAGLIEDDDYSHLESLTLRCGYDKESPRTEIFIYYKE